jgi:filamentous hemagglutinin family protein
MKRIVSFAIGMLAFAFYSTDSQAEITNFTVTGATISKITGLVTVNGTIQCTKGDTAGIADFLNQTLGGKSGIGQASITGVCSGDTQPWSLTQYTFIGSFQTSLQTGNAVIFAQALTFNDGFATDVVQAHQPIKPAP